MDIERTLASLVLGKKVIWAEESSSDSLSWSSGCIVAMHPNSIASGSVNGALDPLSKSQSLCLALECNDPASSHHGITWLLLSNSSLKHVYVQIGVGRVKESEGTHSPVIWYYRPLLSSSSTSLPIEYLGTTTTLPPIMVDSSSVSGLDLEGASKLLDENGKKEVLDWFDRECFLNCLLTGDLPLAEYAVKIFSTDYGIWWKGIVRQHDRETRELIIQDPYQQYLRVNPKFVLVRLICTPTGSNRTLPINPRSSSTQDPVPSSSSQTVPTTSSTISSPPPPNPPSNPPNPPSDRPNDPRSKHKIHSKKAELSENDFAVLKGIVQCISYPIFPYDNPTADPPTEPSPVPGPTVPQALPPHNPPNPSPENSHRFHSPHPPYISDSNRTQNIYRGGSPITSDEDGNHGRLLECAPARRHIDELNSPDRHIHRQEHQPPRNEPDRQTRSESNRYRHDRSDHSNYKTYERDSRDYKGYDRMKHGYSRGCDRTDYRYEHTRESHDYNQNRHERAHSRSESRPKRIGPELASRPISREEKLSPSHHPNLSPTNIVPPGYTSPPLISQNTAHISPPPQYISPIPRPHFFAPNPSPYLQPPPAYTPPYPTVSCPNGLPQQIPQTQDLYSPPMVYPNLINQTPPGPAPLNNPPPNWNIQNSSYPATNHISYPVVGRGRPNYKQKRDFHSQFRREPFERDLYSNLTTLSRATSLETEQKGEPLQQETSEGGLDIVQERHNSPLGIEVDPIPPVCSPITGPFIEPLTDPEETEGVSDEIENMTECPTELSVSIAREGLVFEMKSPNSNSEIDVEEPILKIVIPGEDTVIQTTDEVKPVSTHTNIESCEIIQEPVVDTPQVIEISNTDSALEQIIPEKSKVKSSDSVNCKTSQNLVQTIHRNPEPRILIAPIHNSVLHTSFRSENKSPLFSPPHRAVPLQLAVRYSAALSSDDSLKFSVPFPLPKTPEESPQSDRSNAKSPSVTPSPCHISSPQADTQPPEETDSVPKNTKSKRGKRKSETPTRGRKKRVSNQVALWKETVHGTDGFLQEDACLFYYGPISKCIECKKHGHHSSMSYLTQMVNERQAACGFIGFRKLSDRNKTCNYVTGFLTDSEADNYDLNLWRFNPSNSFARPLPAKEAVYLITSLQYYFCTSMLTDIELHHATSQSNAKLSQVSNQRYPAWKKHAYQARELCDVCETAIFSTHFFCDMCAYTVCRKCFEQKSELPETEQDMCKEFSWRYCTKKRRKHKPSDLLIAEIVPQDIVTETHQEMHSVLKKLDIDKSCVVYDKLPISPPNTKVCPRAIPLTVPTPFPVLAPYTYLCDGQILNLLDAKHEANIRQFRQYWTRGEPLVISNCHRDLDSSLWQPESFSRDFGDEVVKPVDCMTRNLISQINLSTFWNGFTDISERIQSTDCTPLILKLKDWPPDHDFMDKMPERYKDYTNNLPMSEYTTREGTFNLASRLPPEFLKPDLGPKMYIAYGSAAFNSMATTSLHIDISDAMNLMIFVSRTLTTVPDPDLEKIIEEEIMQIDKLIADSSIEVQERAKNPKNIPGALWHIFPAEDSPKIRQFIRKYNEETNRQVKETSDPIHDQSIYLDQGLRNRLLEEYGVQGWEIIQFVGDSIFIPAGAPHQVKNLYNCIKVAEDFVSPENVSHCIQLTEEFRHLSKFHSNHEDKLQIKNIVYHSVKDATGTLKKVLEKYS